MGRYASATVDLPRLGIFTEALEGVSLAQKEQALGAACTLADGYLRDRYSLPLVWNFISLEEREEDGEGEAVEIFDAELFSLALDVTEIEATPEPEEEEDPPVPTSLTVTIEESEDGESDWEEIASFPAVTATGHYTLEIEASQPFVRVVWTITEERSATFGVSFEGDDLKSKVCTIAAYELLSARGLDPNGRDAILIKRYDDSMRWLRDIRAAKTSPFFIDQTPSDDTATGAYTVSKKNRRWL